MSPLLIELTLKKLNKLLSSPLIWLLTKKKTKQIIKMTITKVNNITATATSLR